MLKFRTLFLALVLGALSLMPASAQQSVSPCVRNSAGGCVPVTASAALPVQLAGLSFTNITTSTDTVIKSSAGVFAGLSINTAGTGSTAVVYNNTTCTGAKIGTYTTTAQGVLNLPPLSAGTGICVTTADGGAAANITIFWR